MVAVWTFAAIVFFLRPATSTDSAVICPQGWVESTESATCIKSFFDITTWILARSKCKAVGGDLVKIVNRPMNRFIHGYIFSPVGEYQLYHIGLNSIKQEGTFRWLDEYNKPNFINWAFGEPFENRQYKYVLMYSHVGGWVNLPIQKKANYICEKAAVCRAGRYGETCSNLCSETCGGLDNVCDRVDGTCKNGCDPGYTGTKCDQECDPGFYGEGCEKNCSKHCAGVEKSCHHVNGACDLGCNPGYQNETCTEECDSGYYGDKCSKTCNENCGGETNSCNHVNGSCDLGCDRGYQGDFCSKELPLDRKVEEKVQEGSRWMTNVIIIAAVVVGVGVAVAIFAIGLRVYRRRTLSREQQCKQTEQGGVMVYGLLSDD